MNRISKRHCHTANNTTNPNQIIIIGGQDANIRFQEVFLLDTSTYLPSFFSHRKRIPYISRNSSSRRSMETHCKAHLRKRRQKHLHRRRLRWNRYISRSKYLQISKSNSSYLYLISKQVLFTYLKHSALNQTEEVTPLRRLSVVNCTNLLSIAFLTSFTDISTAEALLSRTRNPTIRRNGTKHSETFTPLTSVLDCHISPLISLDTLMWTCLDTIVTGDIPTPRSGHKMVSFGKQIFLFGGGVWDSVWFEKFSDTYIFDTEKLSWSKPGMLSKNMV